MRAARWQIIISVILSIGVVVLAILNWDKIGEAFALLSQVQVGWLVLAFVLELASFFIASNVYRRALISLGYHISSLRLWAMTLVAILVSQSFPAGGVASYAFLLQSFRRRGVADGHSALLASLEALSYAVAMLLLFGFSTIYIVFRDGISAAGEASLVAAVVGVAVIGGALFVLTRDQAVLLRWLLGAKNAVARLFRRTWSDDLVLRLVGEVVRGRELITARRSELVRLIGIQLVAMTGHALAMLVVLYSLGTATSLLVVLSSFGIALVSSTFNVLPGGGGTVETALALSLQSMGVGTQAITAAVIFRLLNYWLMVPLGLVCYRIVTHGPSLVADQPQNVS